MLLSIRGHEKKDRSVVDIFREWVNRHPNKVCFIFEDQEWTFQQVKYIFLHKKIVHCFLFSIYILILGERDISYRLKYM